MKFQLNLASRIIIKIHSLKYILQALHFGAVDHIVSFSTVSNYSSYNMYILEGFDHGRETFDLN